MQSLRGSNDLLANLARERAKKRAEEVKAAKKAKEEAEAKKADNSSLQNVAEYMFEAQPTYFIRSDFDNAMTDGEKFMFGSATSAYQIEGGRTRGREDSIWDIFADKRGYYKKYNNDAVDHHKYFKDDVGIMKEIGFNAYRFSISWSRVCHYGVGGKAVISQEGIAFYRGLLLELKNKGITPFATLFHWDTPAALQTADYPGFLDKRIVEDFGEYAQICYEAFGDLVENWITLNEPYTYAYLSHVISVHAPGFGSVEENLFETGTNRDDGGSRLPVRRSQSTETWSFDRPSSPELQNSKAYPYIVTHNMLLAHGKAVEKFREYQKNPKFAATRLPNQKIGITLVTMWFEPYNSFDKLDQLAAKRALDFFLGWYLNPLVHGEYPCSMMKKVEKGHIREFDPDEKKLIHGSYDFIGINYYTARYARHKVSKPRHLKNGRNYITDQNLKYYEWCKTKCGNRRRIGTDKGASAWLVSHPEGMQKLLSHLKNKYNDPIIYITENGIDDHDDDSKKNWGSLFDHKRTTYIRDHLYYTLKAIRDDKVRVRGYFVWSLLDNFEWNNNFNVRFGITYVDFKDEHRKRYLKLSATWLQYFLAAKGNQIVATDKLDHTMPSDSDSDDEGN